MDGERLLEQVQREREFLIDARRYLHAHPETGFDLWQTYEYVKGKLVEMGYKPQKCGKSGIVATIGVENAGKTVLLRCDMDGLPIREEADVEYASKNGCMHGCGHDIHTAILLGVAKLLKEYESKLKGTVKLMFQPAEEILEGSKDMINGGVLENPDVDMAVMIHVMPAVPFRTGTVIVSPPGVTAPSADYFSIDIQGKGTHGAMPNEGVDSVTVAANIVLALQEIQARELGLEERGMITIGAINGGDSANVIPDKVKLKGTCRTYNEYTREKIKQRLIEISQGIATTYRASAKVEFQSQCPTLINDTKLYEKVNELAQELLGKEYTIDVEVERKKGEQKIKSSGSEDFAYISHKVPSIMLALAAGNIEDGYTYPLHHPKVTFDEDAMLNGVAILLYIAMKLT